MKKIKTKKYKRKNRRISKRYKGGNNSYTAVIIEPRKHKALSFVLKNILENYKKNNSYNAKFLKELVVTNSFVSVLDIGCGIAGYHSDWMLGRVGDLYLFDSSTFNLASLGYGMGDVNRYYNSLPLAKRYLGQQGIELSSIYTIECNKNHFNLRKYDLIISFISLGFHYHVDTYWAEIAKSLNKNGMIVLDIRNHSSSHKFISDKKLLENFSFKSSVDYGKFTRVCLQKN